MRWTFRWCQGQGFIKLLRQRRPRQKEEDEEQLREQGGSGAKGKQWMVASQTPFQSNRTAKTRSCNGSDIENKASS